MRPHAEHLGTLSRIWRHSFARRDELVQFQNRKLANLVAHAYRNVAYYRELFDRAGVKPGDVHTVRDLRRIPLTSKDDLRARPLKEILSSHAKCDKLVCLKTSGSTGEPFVIRRSRLEEHLINMFRIRARWHAGVRISDRIALVHEAPLGERQRGIAGRLRQTLGIFRQYYIDGLQPGEGIIDELQAHRPDVVVGYPASMGRAASCLAVASSGLVRPRLIITGGEVLRPVMRAHIEKAFDTRIFDMYGAHEFNLIAWECPKESIYHVCDDNVVVEILDKGEAVAPGERGEVVVTALHSYTMPFIRYRTGDVATKGGESCRCGRPYSTLIGVEGRTVGYFRLSGNRWVHPWEITGPLIDHEGNWILQYQLIQQSEDSIILKVVPLRLPQREELVRLRSLGRDKLGPGVDFTVQVVDKFPPQPGGKFIPYPPPPGGWPV